MKVDVNGMGDDGLAPLHIASLEGKMKVVCELLKCDKVDVNRTGEHGETALVLTTKNSDNWDVVRELITHKNVDLNVRGRFGGYTVLMWATLKGELEVV